MKASLIYCTQPVIRVTALVETTAESDVNRRSGSLSVSSSVPSFFLTLVMPATRPACVSAFLPEDRHIFVYLIKIATGSRAGFKCVEALGRIIIRGPYPPSNDIIYTHLQS